MRILINTSNLRFGGGVQVALSFLYELRGMTIEHEFHVFICPALSEQIEEATFNSNFKFYLIGSSPASLKARRRIIRLMSALEEEIAPQVVFTIFGPSYWRPKAMHLMGFADGWVYNERSIAYQKLSFLARFKRRLLNIYKLYYLKKDADFYVIETNDGKNKLSKAASLEKSKITVVGNTYSSVFNEADLLKPDGDNYLKLPPKKNGEFRLVYIAHNKPHKNLQIINHIVPLLNGYDVKFVVTLDKVVFEQLFLPSAQDQVINLGPVVHKSCPSIYSQCDALFAPTLLETFSANYPEAMKMQIPILSSSYSFAKDVCGEAALYFNPLDKDEIAEKIMLIVNDKSLRESLVLKGSARLKDFETAKTRAEKYIKICENSRVISGKAE